MQSTIKSPGKITLEAFEIARQTLPAYSHRFSPQKFTQHQLFAILVLKTHQRKDYRGVIALLEEMPKLIKDLGLKSIPHFTTLQKASERLLEHAQVQQLLDSTVEQFRKKHRPDRTRRGRFDGPGYQPRQPQHHPTVAWPTHSQTALRRTSSSDEKVS